MILSRSPVPALCAAALAIAMAGCTPVDPALIPVDETPVPDFSSAQIPPPPGVNPDGCWVRDVAPAELRTVTRQIEVSPARFDADGTQIAPARFRSETVQEVVSERRALIFETPCPDALTPEFVESLQRALQARGLYRGAVNGQLDIPTQRAIRRYQSGQGIPSGLVSIQTARGLGLIATPRDEL